MRKKFVCSVIAIIIICINTFAFADVGSFESYDSGSDWSSSDDWRKWFELVKQ